jgi:hypothetical protein
MSAQWRLSLLAMVLALPLFSYGKELAPITTVNGLKLELLRLDVSVGQELEPASGSRVPSNDVAYGKPELLKDLKVARDSVTALHYRISALQRTISAIEQNFASNLNRAQSEVEALNKAKTQLIESQEEIRRWREYWQSPNFKAQIPSNSCWQNQEYGTCRRIEVAPGRQDFFSSGYEDHVNQWNPVALTDFVSFRLLSNHSTAMDPVLEIQYEKKSTTNAKEEVHSPYSGVPVFIRASCQVLTVKTTVHDFVPIAVPFVKPTRELRCLLAENRGEVRFKIVE